MINFKGVYYGKNKKSKYSKKKVSNNNIIDINNIDVNNIIYRKSQGLLGMGDSNGYEIIHYILKKGSEGGGLDYLDYKAFLLPTDIKRYLWANCIEDFTSAVNGFKEYGKNLTHEEKVGIIKNLQSASLSKTHEITNSPLVIVLTAILLGLFNKEVTNRFEDFLKLGYSASLTSILKNHFSMKLKILGNDYLKEVSNSNDVYAGNSKLRYLDDFVQLYYNYLIKEIYTVTDYNDTYNLLLKEVTDSYGFYGTYDIDFNRFYLLSDEVIDNLNKYGKNRKRFLNSPILFSNNGFNYIIKEILTKDKVVLDINVFNKNIIINQILILGDCRNSIISVVNPRLLGTNTNILATGENNINNRTMSLCLLGLEMYQHEIENLDDIEDSTDKNFTKDNLVKNLVLDENGVISNKVYVMPHLRKVSRDSFKIDKFKRKHAESLGFTDLEGYTFVVSHDRLYKTKEREEIIKHKRDNDKKVSEFIYDCIYLKNKINTL